MKPFLIPAGYTPPVARVWAATGRPIDAVEARRILKAGFHPLGLSPAQTKELEQILGLEIDSAEGTVPLGVNTFIIWRGGEKFAVMLVTS